MRMLFPSLDTSGRSSLSLPLLSFDIGDVDGDVGGDFDTGEDFNKDCLLVCGYIGILMVILMNRLFIYLLVCGCLHCNIGDIGEDLDKDCLLVNGCLHWQALLY